MALQSLASYVSQLSARGDASLYDIARKCRWERGAVQHMVLAREAPTPKMLRDLAHGLDTSLEDLQNS
jgi:hypothetical protein